MSRGARFTEEDLKSFIKRGMITQKAANAAIALAAAPSMVRPNPKGRSTSKGMNKLEARYGKYLKTLKIAGEIRDYEFQPLKLKLAPKTFYAPDYLVVTDQVEIHEVKGHWEDDARVKIKVAAKMFWWMKFIAITEEDGVWRREEFL